MCFTVSLQLTCQCKMLKPPQRTCCRSRIDGLSPPLPTGSLPVVMCWCGVRGRCLFISLTSPIKIHSANEPSLSPPVIKTYSLMCTALSPTGPLLSLSSPWLRYCTKHTFVTMLGRNGWFNAAGGFGETKHKPVLCVMVHRNYHVVQRRLGSDRPKEYLKQLCC